MLDKWSILFRYCKFTKAEFVDEFGGEIGAKEIHDPLEFFFD